jgi:hypothetical protein
LRQRRKLDRLFSVEISALRACSETESKRKSEQPFHFCPPVVQSQRAFCRNMLSTRAVKEMDLRGGLLIY